MKLRTQILFTLATSALVLGFMGWMIWRYLPRSAPLPWGTLGLLAAAVVVVPLLGIPVNRWLHAPGNRNRAAHWLKTPRGRVLWGLTIAVAWVAVAPLVVRGTGASWFAGMLGNLPMGLMFLGLPMAFGCVVRRGDMPVCAGCGYDLSGASGEPRDDDRCPECGAMFRRAGGTERGRKVVDRRLLVAGVLCISVMVVFLVAGLRSPLRAARWHVGLLPTGSLIKEVTAAPRGFTMDEWAEIGKRTLSREQELRLARGLLDQRSKKGFIAAEGEAWLLAAATSGRLPPELLDRYFAEWLEAWVVAPDRARVRVPVTVGVSTLDRGGGSFGLGSRLAAHVLFEGFGVNDEPLTRGRSALLQFGLMMQPQEVYGVGRGRFGGRPQALADGSPSVSVIPDSPGRLRVRAALWIVICPFGTEFKTEWADDTPTLPEGTRSARRIELERTVIVDP